MRNKIRRLGKLGVVGLVLSMVVAGAGLAWALWTTTANGNAAAQARTMTFSLAASSATADLYPSSSATGSVSFTVTNPNPFTIEVTDVTGNGAVVPTDPVACPAANVTTGTVTGLSGAAYQAAGSGGTKTMTIAGILTMATGAPNGCQGMTFTVPVTVTARIITS